MKKICLISLSLIWTLIWSMDIAYSRGGFGGGGRGGFGGGRGGFGGAEFRGGGSESRGHLGESYRGERPQRNEMRQKDRQTPQRIDSRRSGTPSGERGLPKNIEAKPTPQNLQKFLNLPPENRGGLSDLGKIGAGAAAGALGAVGAQHLMERPGLGDRQGRGDRPDRIDRDHSGQGRPDRLSDRDNINAGQIRNNFKDRYDNLFTPKWWADHPNLAHQYWENMGRYQYAWNHWWRPAAWGALAGWVAGAAWSSPQYFDYSSGIYYQGDNVYVNDTPVGSASEYYQQASSIASSNVASESQDSQSQEEQWMPLGVFALSQVDTTTSNTILQLAVDKQGVIKGTYYNTNTQVARPVKGSVDRKSQRAAWTFADGKDTDIVMETGIYNLTLDQTEALVHFGKDKTQRWLMVRMEQPQKQDSSKAAQN